MLFKHALHNEEVCYFLKKQNKYNDWVVTIAFYSALHFIKSDLFPLLYTEKGKTIKYITFEEMVRKRPLSKNKHQYLVDLVYEERNNIGVDYEILRDLSNNSRYIDYQTDNSVVEKAIECLKNIKDDCYKP